jgi:ppGpp synthetase/RelA/SpoT-type nucleotidyltranferase
MTKTSINMKEFERQVRAYREIQGVYKVFAQVLTAVLTRAVKDLGLSAIVQARAKDIPSFAEKTIRKQDLYPDPVNQFTDLCGARIIVDYKDEIEPVCEFIRKHFEIDEANTEDVLERLGVGEFGYRSVHFILSLKQGEFKSLLEGLSGSKRFKKTLDRLYERRTEEACEQNKLLPGPRFKAEVQVRTLIQHAWAGFAHDRIYKSEFDVPRRWKRDANRIAATLEEADDAFARTIRGVENYKTYYGAYMTRQEREIERDKLEAVFHYDSHNMRLAHKIARLALSLEDFQLAEEKLRPFVSKWESTLKGARLVKASEVLRHRQNSSQDAVELAELDLERLRDPELSGVLLDFGWAEWKRGKAGGRDYIEWAIDLNRENVDARVALAETYIDEGNLDEALECYEEAYKTAPSNPRALGGFIRCKLILERNLDFIPMIRPSLEAGIARCQERAKVKVYLPEAYYDISLFALLLGRPYECLTAYCRAVQLSDSESDIMKTLEWVGKLRGIKNKLPELDWVRRFLLTAKVAKLLSLATIAEENENTKSKEWQVAKRELEALQEMPEPHRDQESIQKAKAKRVKALREFKKARERAKVAREKAAVSRRESLRKKMITPNLPTFEGPLVIVAGGCEKEVEDKVLEYRSLLQKAFEGFHGIVFSGGTTAGISGLVGDLPSSRKGPIRKIAYLPDSIPMWTRLHDAYEVYQTAGSRFSALQTLQMWTNILASGIDPADVKLLGINGGRIAAFEFRLAVALGARAGIIADSGRAASEIFEDPDWIDVPGLLRLPNDTRTVRAFVQGLAPSQVIEAEYREKMAITAHKESLKKKKKDYAQKDPAMVEYEDLPSDFQYSLLDQIGYYEEELRAAGFEIRKVPKGQDVTPIDFSEDTKQMREKVEIMAEIEHGRWNAERLMRGWTLGEKDVEKKKSPYLVSWTELPDHIKEYDRNYVRAIPRVLAAFGYEIVPI